jgi:hypothetical protein
MHASGKVVSTLFDPTAFENIKVVIEGAVYDRDLQGDILVTDREDIVNLAKLSRKYSVSFQMRLEEDCDIKAVLTIEAGLENLAAELLGTDGSLHLAGCAVTAGFLLRHPHEEKLYGKIQHALERIWGTGRTITQAVTLNPLQAGTFVKNEAAVHFNRLVLEDQIEDLAEMVDYMIASLRELELCIGKG